MKLSPRPCAVRKALIKLSGLFLFLFIFSIQAVAQVPVASFNADKTTGCNPLTVNFTNTSVQANSYFWNFGNGNTSTLVNPTTVYIAPGTYTVTLIAINTISGNRDTLTEVDYIFVSDDPISDFTAPVLTGCVNSNSISFTNLSLNAVSYIWDFGDGGFSTATNPTHSYTAPGTYTVKLIAENTYGCTKVKIRTAYITIDPAPTASFNVNQQSSCDQNQLFTFTSTSNGAIAWSWDFGDGSTSILENPTHTYGAQGTYTVTLIVTNSFGCTDTSQQQSFINIGANLVPTFTSTGQSGCAPFDVTFNSTVSGATSWLWNFGDGNSSVLENPQHTFVNPGLYDITLSVTTGLGCNGSVTIPAYINVEAIPVAQFTVTNPSGCGPITVDFNNNSTGATTYLWSFGNGDTSVDENPQITFTGTGIYDVTLLVTSSGGCTDSMTLTGAVIINSITAAFSANPIIGCAPLPVDFTGLSNPPATGWEWDLGNGNTSTLPNPSTVYNSIGNYTVSLIVTSAEGCTDTLTVVDYIQVVSDSTPYIVPDTIIVCTPPGGVSFTDPTIGSNGWSWDFGDGDSSNLSNPTHTYTVPGIYTVVLNTVMAGGCTQNFDPFAIINVIPFDTLPIISAITSPCGPFTVQLDNQTPNVASYLWDFGDGTTSTLQNPTHTYAEQGTYTITLLLTAINSCQMMLSTTVTFGYELPVSISNDDACQGDSIHFSLNPLSSFTSAIWDFGDGSPLSNQFEPSHIYNSEGVYNVSVTVTDINGCVFTYSGPDSILISNPLPSFTVNQPTEGCVSFNVQFINTSTGVNSYLWSFGDGATSTQASPSHNYTTPGVYTVNLNATTNGCVRDYTLIDLITANQAVADFSFTPSTGCLPITVTYTDLSVNPVSWFWEFGDGDTSIVQNPVHTFTIDPPSNVKLTITDINGCSRTRSKLNINPVIPMIVASDSIGCRPLLVNFSTPTIAATYIWDFGDGTSASTQNASHIYTQSGTFTVTLTCILASGCTTTTVKPDFIEVIAPVSDFMSPTVSVCAPSLVDFVNQSTGATSWLWDFGDGTTSTNENPSHIYNIPGAYTITLISYSAEGCPDTLVKVDYIVVPGTYSDFTLGSAINCLNTMVQFLDQSINATSWFWNFGDGFTSTVQNPLHLYADTGSYIVTLITSDSTGCSSFYSGSNPVTIHEIPAAAATLNNTSGCQPLEVEFVNNSTGSISYTWYFGNGDSSIAGDTTYQYLQAGLYTPYLVAQNVVGCTDTIAFINGVNVYPVPVAGYITSGVQGCSPFNVSFINSSSNTSTPSYFWDFGNGLISIAENPVIMYTDSGTFDVSMIVTNIEGCSDTLNTFILVNQSPEAVATVNASDGCVPYEITFISNSLNASSILWNFGNGDTSVSDTVNYTYNTPGVYQPYLVAYSAAGCTDTMYLSNPVQINPLPVAAFTVNQSAGCPGTNFQFTSNSTPSSGLTFEWMIAGVTSTVQNPDITLNTTGFYDASLVVTNQFGCTDTLNQLNYLQVYDTIPPPVSPIVSVSVLSNTDVEINWLNSAVLDLGAYVLYRKDASTGAFVEIYRDTTPMNAGLNVTSKYTDTGLNTLQNTYTYKLQTLDLCSYTLPLSALTPHTTINITAVPSGNNINVSWTEYKGCNVASYELYRINMVTGAAGQIAVLAPNVRTYVDNGFPCPHEFSYRVTATELCGNTYTSLSDTSNAIPVNILADQKVEVVRSTVIGDKDVLTEWLPPVLAPERVKEYRIFRSADNVSFVYVATVPSGVLSYIDYNAFVHQQEYYYKVEVVSDCDVAGSPSNNSSSIWLQSDHKNDITKLWWTPYSEWDTGVDFYIIERESWSGQWEQIKQVPGTTQDITFDD